MSRKRIAVAVFAACAIGTALQAHAGTAVPGHGGARAPDPVSEAAMDAHRAWRIDTAVRLSVNGDARELALAALLASSGDVDAEGNVALVAEPEAAAWARRASANAAGDAIANLLLASAHADDPASAGIRHAAAARWRTAEPDNLAPLLYLDLEPAELVAAAADSRRFSLHVVETIRWAAGAMAAHPPTAEMQAAFDAEWYAAGEGAAPGAREQAMLQAAGIVVAFAIPNLGQLTEACGADAMETDPPRRDACAHVAAVMRHASDTELGAGIGRALSRRLASPDALAGLDAEDRQRRWTTQQMGIALPGHVPSALLALYADPALTTEQALAERAILEAGLPLVPPDDWNPRSAF